jgi:hypothetical protein
MRTPAPSRRMRTALTITLFDGGTLTGKVTDETEIECESSGDGDHGDCDSDKCAEDALKVGANVKEAELKVTSEGRIWEELELR